MNIVNKNKKLFTGSISAILIIFIISILHLSGFFNRINLNIIDFITRQSAQPEKAGKNHIAYAIIADSSLKIADSHLDMGWPWRRKYYGKICELTRLCGAKTTVFDFLFSEKSVYRVSSKKPYHEVNDDREFAKNIKKNSKVIIGYRFNSTAPSGKDEKKLKSLMNHIETSSLKLTVKNSSVRFKEYPGIIQPVTKVLKAAAFIGDTEGISDKDGFFRKAPLIIKFRDKFYPSLPLAAYMLANNIKKASLTGNTLTIGKLKIPLDKNGNLYVKFYGDNNVYYDFNVIYFFFALDKIKRHYLAYKKITHNQPQYSLEQICRDKIKYQKVLKKISTGAKPDSFPVLGLKKWKKDGKIIKKEFLYPWTITGKHIIVGSIAAGLLDLAPTPFNPKEAGMHIHGTVLDNLMQSDFLQVLENDSIYLLLIIIFSILTLYVCFRFSITTGIISAALFLFLIISISWILFAHANLVFYPLSGMLSVIASFIVATIFNYISERRQKMYIKNAFSQYLSPKIIDIIIKDPSKLALGGQKKEMTAFFSDLQNFSSISEKLPPEKLVSLLNNYLTKMCDIIIKYDGTVDKFEGDAIIAFWGAPAGQLDHAMLACKTNIEMQKAMVELRKKLKAEGKPELHMRIGINTGNMVVGNMGSAMRMDYTIMGDSVNLAARLEGANKIYGTYSMISEYTYSAVKDEIEARELDRIIVPGKEQPVTVYELLELKGSLSLEKQKIMEIYYQGLNAYKEMKFEKALEYFKQVTDQANDPPSQTYIARCKAFSKNPPPADWDKVFRLIEKG